MKKVKQRAVGLKVDEEVDVAFLARVAACDRAEQRDLESAVPSNGSLDLLAAVLDEGPQVLASLRCHSSRLRRGNQHTREGPLRDRGRLHSPGTPASPALNMVRRSAHSAHTSSAANENWSATLR